MKLKIGGCANLIGTFEFKITTRSNCNNRGSISIGNWTPTRVRPLFSRRETSHHTHNRTIQSNQSMIIITDVKRSHPISSIADPVWSRGPICGHVPRNKPLSTQPLLPCRSSLKFCIAIVLILTPSLITYFESSLSDNQALQTLLFQN